MTTASATINGTSYSAGDLVATYEYDAFGKTLRESGAYAADNPFRFSTKYTDNETALVYYGHRYYSPSLGRFINRDPIEEQGGINLYSFVGNNSINAYDYLGMDAFMTTYETSDGKVHWVEGDGMNGQDYLDAATMASNMAVAGTGNYNAKNSGAAAASRKRQGRATLRKFNALPPEVQDAVLLQIAWDKHSKADRNTATLNMINSSLAAASMTSNSASAGGMGGDVSVSTNFSNDPTTSIFYGALEVVGVVDDFANLATVDHSVPEYNHERTMAFVNSGPSETSSQYLGRHLGSGFDSPVFRNPLQTLGIVMGQQAAVVGGMFVVAAAAPVVVPAIYAGAQNAYVYGTVAAGTKGGQRAMKYIMDVVGSLNSDAPSIPNTLSGYATGKTVNTILNE